MFFVISKLAWTFAAPLNALLFGLLAAGFLRGLGQRQAARRLAILCGTVLICIGILPAGSLILRPLENRFPGPSEPLPPPTGVIVLGGSTDETISEARDQVTVFQAATRITTAVTLAHRFPQARLVFSGGSGALILRRRSEAEDTRRLWIDMGVAPERITIEDKSRNTDENARFTKALLDPKPDERWILVTSAFHMPRAIGLFRADGLPVTPYPVDYMTSGTWTDWLISRDAIMNFKRFDIATREWIGLAVYRATGRTDRLFPAPDAAADPSDHHLP